MITGIKFNGKHSFFDWGAIISSRDIGVPPKKKVTATVPYSSTVYDFSSLYGKASYEDRTLSYVFTLIAKPHENIRAKTRDFMDWLYGTYERSALFDDIDPYHYYNAECTTLSSPTYKGHVAQLTATFTADSHAHSTIGEDNDDSADGSEIVYTAYPDVNGDGVVDSSDASIISQMCSLLGAGETLTDYYTAEQIALADADGDGEITVSDVSLVKQYASKVGSGEFEDSADGWTAFLTKYGGG